jgi:acetolactate synthase-1/3 small subunit
MRERPKPKPVEKQVITMLVDDQPNVMARITSLFGRRNFNINTLSASETNIPGVTRVTLVVSCDDENALWQIVTQVEKLEVVQKTIVLDMDKTLYRELLLLKVAADKHSRTSIREIVDIYRAKIIDLSKNSMVIELTGSPTKIDGFMNMMDCYDIIEVSRTGVTGIERSV